MRRRGVPHEAAAAVHEAALAVAHEGLVVPGVLAHMVGLPAAAAEVVEAGDVAAEVGALPQAARGAQGVFEVRIHLNLKTTYGFENTRFHELYVRSRRGL